MAFINPIFRQPTASASGIGFQPGPIIFHMICATAVARGDVLAVVQTPNSDGFLDTVITPVANDLHDGGSGGVLYRELCVALEDQPTVNTPFACMFSGMCDINNSIASVAGTYYMPTSAARTLQAAAAAVGQGNRIVAQCRVAVGAAGLAKMYFDGLGGIFRACTNTT